MNHLPLWNASAFVGLESYTDSDLLISKHVGSSYLIGKTYYMSPISGGGGDLSGVIADLVKTLPEQSIVQTLEMSFPDRNVQFDYMRGKTSTNPLIASLVRAQSNVFVQALKVGWQDDTPALNKKRLAISLAVPVRTPDEETVETQERTQASFLVNLRSCGFFDVRALKAPEVLGLYRGMVELSEPIPVDLDPLLELNKQAFQPHTDFDFSSRDTGIIAGRHMGCVAVNFFPKVASASLMNLVAGAPMNSGPPLEGGGIRVLCPWMICTTVRMAKQDREETRVQRAITSRTNGEKIPLNLGLEDSSVVLQDLLALQKQCANNQDVYVMVSIQAFVFGDSRSEVLEHTATMKTVLNKLKFESYEVPYFHGMMFSQMLPMNYSLALAENLDNEVPMSGKAAARLLPVFSDDTGNAMHAPITGSMFITRRGQAYAFDPYRSHTGANGCIAATTGAGKSFLTQYMITNALADGTQVFLFDNGRSAKKLADAIGPEDALFQDFDASSPSTLISCNPFSNLTPADFEEQKDTIVNLLLKMAYFEEAEDKGARIAMQEAVIAAWENQQADADIDTVIASLRKTAEQGLDNKVLSEVLIAATNLGPRLYSFMESKGRFFRGRSNLNIGAQFVVYELGKLSGDRHLKQCVLFFVMNTLLGQIRNLKGRKLIMLDEAWELLLDDGAALVMESLYRKVRKDTGSVWVVTQSLLDLAESRTGKVVLAQSQWKLILEQKGGEIEKLIKAEELPEYTTDPYFCKLLRGVKSRKGVCSEVLITGGGGYELVRLYVDAFTVALFSTDEDRDQVFQLMQGGMGAVEAILQVTQNDEARLNRWLNEVSDIMKRQYKLSVSQAKERLSLAMKDLT